MEKQEMEFLRFVELCVAERRRGKSVDEIWQAWKDQEKRDKELSSVLDKLNLRELAILNAALKAAVGTEV